MLWSLSLAELLFPVLGILVAVYSLILIIKPGGPSVVRVNMSITETPVEKILCPASVNKIGVVSGSDEESVELSIQTYLERCKVVAYWGVPIKDLPSSGEEPNHQHKEEHLLEAKNGHRLLLSVKKCELGGPPRTHFHLMTVISAPGTDFKLYTFYKLKEDPQPFAIRKQYLRADSGSHSGRMLAVNMIFVAGNDNLCVICFVVPMTHTMLPCKHMCICSECLAQLDLQQNGCPVCREPVVSYFVADSLPVSEENDPALLPQAPEQRANPIARE